ncbi:MAG TPA: hypothetical protein VFY26_10240 [Anaerolineales bacterium]|nr:hypothetical protein [Anaerolineales bacterium]
MTPKRVRFLVLSLIGIGLIVVALFGVRAYYAWREVRGQPPPQDVLMEAIPDAADAELIRDWMTIPFIARMYNIPSSEFYEALDIPRRGNEIKSLTQLNSQYFPETPGIVETKVKTVVLQHITPEEPPTEPAP